MLKQLLQRLSIARVVSLFLLLVAVNLFAPFHADDYFQQLLLRGDSQLLRDNDASLYGLFSFIDSQEENRAQMERFGVLPWFADQSFYFRFFRPIAELTHKFDAWVAQESASFAHAQSIFWFLLVLAAFYALVWESFPEHKTLAVLALAIFAWDGQHVATIHWIANRNALIACVFVLLSLLAFMRSRRIHRKAYYFCSIALFAVALLSAESAVALLIYLVCYLIFLEQSGWLKRIGLLAPYVLVLVVWQIFYRQYGFGADTAQGLYLDPLADFPEFIVAFLQRFPVYFTAALLPMPAGLMWGGGSQLPWLLYFITTFSIGFMLWVIYRFRDFLRIDKRILFWFIAGMLSVLPVTATLAQDRLSLMQTVGVDIAMAAIIYGLLQEQALSRFKRIMLQALVVIHLLLSPLHLLAGSVYMTLTAKLIADKALHFTDEDLTGKTIIALRMPIGESTSLVGIRRFHSASIPESFLWLANDESPVEARWLDATRMSVTKNEGFGSGHEAVFGRDHKPAFFVGQRIVHPAAEIEIMALTDQGLSMRIELHFKDAAFAQSVLLFDYQQGILREQTVLKQ